MISGRFYKLARQVDSVSQVLPEASSAAAAAAAAGAGGEHDGHGQPVVRMPRQLSVFQKERGCRAGSAAMVIVLFFFRKCVPG